MMARKLPEQGSDQLILAHALRLVVVSGYRGTTMAAVAKASGLPIGSLYWHFKNKEELFAALVNYCFSQWEARHYGRSNRELLFESIAQSAANADSPAHPEEAFWGIGLLLALERNFEENLARQTYLQVRQKMFELMIARITPMIPPEAIAADPEIVRKVVTIGRALTNGFYVSAAAGDDIDFQEAAELATIATEALVSSTLGTNNWTWDSVNQESDPI